MLYFGPDHQIFKIVVSIPTEGRGYGGGWAVGGVGLYGWARNYNRGRIGARAFPCACTTPPLLQKYDSCLHQQKTVYTNKYCTQIMYLQIKSTFILSYLKSSLRLKNEPVEKKIQIMQAICRIIKTVHILFL